MTPELRFGAAMLDIEADVPLDRIGLAVSGGGDSLALLFLARDWAERRGAELHAITVDHGLRPEAAGEAMHVAALCRAVRVPHSVLTWGGWDGRGNLQDAAREARRALIGDWAAARRLQVVLTGHTKDDQAETVLMRLARGSGVDGLAGIAPVSRAGGVVWARPLLGHGRGELRDWLSGRGVTWVEDPSNDDPRFDRVKARRMLDVLGDLGLSVDRLAATAGRMGAASEALSAATGALAARCVTVDRGDLVIDRRALYAAPVDLQRRLIAAALGWVSGQGYRPRYDALLGLMRNCAAGRGGTLQGCLVTVQGRECLRVIREAKAVANVMAEPGALWDGRWRLDGPWQPGDRIAATGKALFALADWREAGLPQESLLAAPAIWRDGALHAAPLAGHGRGFAARLAQGRDDFVFPANLH